MVVSCAPTPKFPSYAPPNPSPAFQTPAYSDPYAAVPAPSIFRPNSAAPNIRAASYILIDANTGRTLAARNADAARGVASTQKLVTALVVSKSGNLDRSLRVESSDTRVEPTKIGLVPGETLSRKSVLYAFLVKSGNDGANALARDNAGSIPAFAARMNGMARHCGASNSHFVNPHGLSAPGQYSTARDMAKIAMMAYRDPVIRDVVKQRYVSFHGHSLKNTNDLLNRMPECNGMKTGYTNAAGKCLVSSASRYGKAVILVQLGSHLKYIWDDGQAMMNWGLANL
jgi:D-alanyl-D-alanine carboxypeptidase (penicillin-binding protein 5/6)